MSFTRSLIFAAIIVSAGLWALGLTLMPTEEHEAYAALVCSEAVPDRDICTRLESRGFTGIVSESGQWVMLDCFTGIEQIALDEYPSRVFPFDPRNDGYAEKLRSLFVRDNKRYVFIPLGAPMRTKLPKIEKELAAALGDIPYALEYGPGNNGADQRLGLSLVLLFIAIASFGIIRPLRLELKPNAACLVPCLIILSPLASGGAVGFALASLLAGCAALAATLCLERTSKRRWLLPPLLAAGYVLLAFFSNLPLVFTLLVLALFCVTLILSLYSASRVAAGHAFHRRETGHQRFSPVLIIKRRSSGLAFAWTMLPFAAAALILACVSVAGSVSSPRSPSLLPSAAALTEADYISHYLFQATFSQKSLHQANAPAAMPAADAPQAGGMGWYELDSDGLLAHRANNESSMYAEAEALLANIPPFPLSDFYLNIDTSERATGLHNLLLTLLPLLFILPALKLTMKRGSRGTST